MLYWTNRPNEICKADCNLFRGLERRSNTKSIFNHLTTWWGDLKNIQEIPQWLFDLPDNVPKVPILKEVTSEKCNSVELNTFPTYLSSILGVIAEYNSNHAKKWGQICWKSVQQVFNSTELYFSEVYFFQNWYFSNHSKARPYL